MNDSDRASLIWGVADLLRGHFKQHEYGKVILPLAIMRRLDQVLAPTKKKVLKEAERREAAGVQNLEDPLCIAAGQQFFNRSPMTLDDVLADERNVRVLLEDYIQGYSALAAQIMEHFDFDDQVERLDKAEILYPVLQQVCSVDLGPDSVSNADMGTVFEDLIRRFAEVSNETAGEHFTPRDASALLVDLLITGDAESELLTTPGKRIDILDPADGTAGLLSMAADRILEYNRDADVHLYGQELNPESFAIGLADMLIQGQDATNMVLGNTLTHDGHKGLHFHYGLANPPFGIDWKGVEVKVKAEHEELGFEGRFGPGVPRVSNGQMLFLLHLMSKMRAPTDGGGRIAIVLNGSPLFNGAAGSGESEIRRWIIENDMLEAIVALPEQLFFSTGIATYIWVITNRKEPRRAGAVQLIDARNMWVKMRKSLGEKRREITRDQINEIVRLYGQYAEDERVKIVPNESFGYRTITVEQPLRAYWKIEVETTFEGGEEIKQVAKLNDEQRDGLMQGLLGIEPGTYETAAEVRQRIAEVARKAVDKPSAALLNALVDQCMVRDPEAPIIRDKHGDPVPDPDLRDTENLPLAEDVGDYLAREVHPWVPDAWCPDPEGKVGYEIPFSRLFYTYTPPRSSTEIKADLKELEGEVHRLLAEVLA